MDLVTHRNKEKKGDNVTLLSEGELVAMVNLISLREMLANRLYLQCRMFTVLHCNYLSVTGSINQGFYVN